MNDAEVVHKELESLLDFRKAFAGGEVRAVLHEAEIALHGNSGNPAALQALASNLRGLRQNILSELRSRLN
jgi:hypothetical protein